MSTNEKKTAKTASRMPEFLRRFFVALKRKPSTIALVVLLVAFFQYSLNLTHISDTTAKIQGPGMGLCGFATMLLSMLSLVCFLNAFPRRKKPVIPMVVLMFVMLAVIFFCDTHYANLIYIAVTRAENPIQKTAYMEQAYSVLWVHKWLVAAGAGLTALLPVYSKLLRKINTSVTVEDYGKLQEIDISGED